MIKLNFHIYGVTISYVLLITYQECSIMSHDMPHDCAGFPYFTFFIIMCVKRSFR